MRKAIIITLTLGSALAACTPAKPIHDKAYFAVHDAERDDMVAACRNNPGQSGGDPNCVNALQARADIGRKKFWTVTPPGSRLANPGKL